MLFKKLFQSLLLATFIVPAAIIAHAADMSLLKVSYDPIREPYQIDQPGKK